MYSYGTLGHRGGGMLQRLATLIPTLSSMPWQLSLSWHPGVGLTAGLYPGVSGVEMGRGAFMPGAITPGALATPFFPGAFYGGAAPYVQGASVMPLLSTLPMAVSPLGYGAISPFTVGAMPYAQGAAAVPYAAAPYLSSFTPLAGLGLTGAWAPAAGAYAPLGVYTPTGAWAPGYGVSGAISPLGMTGWTGAYAQTGAGLSAAGAYPTGALPYVGTATASDLAYAPYAALQ